MVLTLSLSPSLFLSLACHFHTQTEATHHRFLPHNAANSNKVWLTSELAQAKPTLSALAAFNDRTLSPCAVISFNKSSGLPEGAAILTGGVETGSMSAGGGFFFAGCWGSVGPSALLFYRDKIVVDYPFFEPLTAITLNTHLTPGQESQSQNSARYATEKAQRNWQTS